jgi:hypothetical protein
MTDQQDPASRSPYEVPTPYGSAAGTESASSVAAPLLAGGALALAGVVVQQEDSLRYPGVVLVLLVAAVVMLVTAVQCGFWARRYAVTPDEIRQWWPDANPARLKKIQDEQHRHADYHYKWSRRTAITFNVGILLLWAALGLAVTPKDGMQEPTWRWVAAGLAGLAALIEVVWIILGVLGQRPTRPCPGPTRPDRAEGDPERPRATSTVMLGPLGEVRGAASRLGIARTGFPAGPGSRRRGSVGGRPRCGRRAAGPPAPSG